MARLKRDISVFVRRMQVSRHSYIVCIEGKTDREMCRRILESCPVIPAGSYQIIRSNEINNQDLSNKTMVLSFYRYLRRNDKLYTRLGPTSMAAFIFFVDADADGLLRKHAKSSHVIYTPCYNIECLSLKGDLEQSVMVAAEPADADLARFCNKHLSADIFEYLARTWSSWIIYCFTCRVLSERYGVQVSDNFSIQFPPVIWVSGEPILNKLALSKRWLRLRNSVPQSAMFYDSRRVSKKYYHKCLASGHAAHLVNGKWVLRYWSHIINRDLVGNDRFCPLIEAKASVSLLHTFAGSKYVNKYYRNKLDNLLSSFT